MDNKMIVKSGVALQFSSVESKKEFVRSNLRREQATAIAWCEDYNPGEDEGMYSWTPEQESKFQALLASARRQSILADSTPTGKATSDSSRIHGVICKQAITNSRWWQEGVSLFNPSAEMRVQLNKAESVLFHMDSQPQSIKATIGYPVTGRNDGIAYAKAREQFKGLIGELFDSKVGQTFNRNAVVVKGLGVTLRQSKMNQPLTLLSYSMEDAPFAPGAVQVNLKYEMQLTSPWKKVRGYGLKATLVPWDVQRVDFEGIDEDFIIMHSMSGLKGKPLDLVAFSHSIGGAEVNIREGVIVPTSGKWAGKAFDISKPDSVVDKWRNATARKITVHFDYSRSEWEFIKAVDMAEGVYNKPGYDVQAVNELDEQTVRISAHIEILVAEMPLNIEVSLPEESSGKTQLTPEMLSVLTLQSRTIGEQMNKLGAGKRNSLTKLLKMFKGNPAKETPKYNIQESEFLSSIQTLIKDGMNDSEVIKAYETQFPSGAVFTSHGHESTHSLYLDFTAIQGIGAYVGGSGEGVAHSIAEFLRTLPNNLNVTGSESTIHGNFALICNSVKGWFKVQLESKNLKKKLVSSLKGTAFGSKIRTIALPELSHKGTAPNCLPKVGINPNDDILRELARSPFTSEIPARFKDEQGKFDPYLMNGELVSLFRTPMPMEGACEIVITKRIGVGHLGLLMHVWAMFNEGDSDGDGVAIIPGFHYLDNAGIVDVDARRKHMLAMNTHPMGMQGYILAYGPNVKDWPCAEFSSHVDAWTKKAIIVEAGSKALAKQIDKGILPYARNKAVSEWISTVGQVNEHYRNGVSTSYNIAVVAVNDALDLQYKLWNIGLDYEIEYAKANDPETATLAKQLTLALRTCAIAWRLLYEGLGLAGYSDGASKWFKLFNLASSGTHYVEGAFGPKPLAKGMKPEEGMSIASALADGAGFSHRKDAHLIAGALCRISVILADARALEKPENNPDRYESVITSATRFNTAVVRRAQRMCSQGDDAMLREGLEKDDAPDEMNVMDMYGEDATPSGQSCLESFIDNKLWGQLACKWQRDNLQRASLFVSESIKLTAAFTDNSGPDDNSFA